MRKILSITLFALAILISANLSASAQHGYTVEKPLKFAAGKSVVVRRGRVPDTLESHTYILKAPAGQTLYIEFESKNPNVSFMVLDAEDNQIGEAASKKRSWKSELPAAGEYRILVHSIEGAGNYALTVRIK